jgi:hypothetical protein
VGLAIKYCFICDMLTRYKFECKKVSAFVVTPANRPMSAIHVAKNDLDIHFNKSHHWALAPSTFVRRAWCYAWSPLRSWVLNGYEIQLRSQTTKKKIVADLWRSTWRTLVHYNHPLQLMSRNCISNKSFWLATRGFWLSTVQNCNQKSPGDNQNDYYNMHFLVTSHNGQVATNDVHVMMLW